MIKNISLHVQYRQNCCQSSLLNPHMENLQTQRANCIYKVVRRQSIPIHPMPCPIPRQPLNFLEESEVINNLVCVSMDFLTLDISCK
jgi:hypothetical protein